MRALSRAMQRDQGHPVCVPWSTLAKYVKPQRGNIGVIIARPGAGKSALALNWLLGCDEPTTLLSLDTDLLTQGVRAVGVLSGTNTEEVAKHPKKWGSYLEGQTKKLRVYDSTVSIEELGELLGAEEQFWGRPPAMLVVDNLTDMVPESNFEAITVMLNKLKRLAREHHTFILVLHHTRRTSKDPPSLHSGEYGGEKQAQVMLGLWQPKGTEGVLRVSVLKNRNGKADATGNLWVPLNFDLDTMRVEERSQAQRYLDAFAGNRPMPQNTTGPYMQPVTP